MATFDLPASLQPQAMEWGTVKAGVMHRSPFNGNVEAVEFPGERWRISLTLSARRADQAAQAEAFFARLAGGVHRLRLHHLLRPVPVGTLRGAPVVASLAPRGSDSIAITTTGTLKAGDMFKVGNQLCQCFADCSPVAGTLSVPLVQRLRLQVNAGAAVEWDRPTFLACYPAMSHAMGYSPGIAAAFTVDLEEVFA